MVDLPETSSWEKRFEEESPLAFSGREWAKDFIRSVASSEYKRGVEEGIDTFWKDGDLQEAITFYGEWNGTELDVVAKSVRERLTGK